MNYLESSADVAVSSERPTFVELFAWMFLALALTTGVAAYLNGPADVAGYVDDHPAASGSSSPSSSGWCSACRS